jgi:hypothetical protein
MLAHHSLMYVLYTLFVFEIGSLCIAQAGLKLAILLPQPLSARITDIHYHTLPETQ